MTDLADRGAGAVDDTDAVDLILADHEEMERLLRLLRDDTQDRGAVRAELADLLVAHAKAEEDVVYPVLERQADAEGEDEVEDEVEHGEEEHAEINEALLAVLELSDLDGDDFTEALEELGEMVHHHLSEEERNVLNPARELVEPARRRAVGDSFLGARRGILASHPGRLANVRRLVEEARAEGLLD